MEQIRYDGKMTDMIPAECWMWATGYAYNVDDYTKVSNYLKEHHGRKRIKLEWVTIKEITSSPTLTKPKLQVIQLNDGKTSENGKQYYAKTETIFSIDKQYYRVVREILMWISECMSAVTESKLKLYKQDNDMPIIEVE